MSKKVICIPVNGGGSPRITFEQLRKEHLSLLLEWLEAPHVKQWWDQDLIYTPSLVEQNYGKYIYQDEGNDIHLHETYAYISYVDNIPIGYIQFYDANNTSKESILKTNMPKKIVGCDLFVGDEKCIGKGLGLQILIKFLEKYVDPYYDACIVDPDHSNTKAIKMYERAGFIQIDEADRKSNTVTWMVRNSKMDKLTQTLNELSQEINALYGYVKVEGENIEEPAINVGPCGAFAYAFYKAWNQRFNQKVSIAFIMVKNSDECWHVLIRLPNGMLFDGGLGVHDEQKYNDRFTIEDMKDFNLAVLDEKSHGLEREYPRYCPHFSLVKVTSLIVKHLDRLQGI